MFSLQPISFGVGAYTHSHIRRAFACLRARIYLRARVRMNDERERSLREPVPIYAVYTRDTLITVRPALQTRVASHNHAGRTTRLDE